MRRFLRWWFGPCSDTCRGAECYYWRGHKWLARLMPYGDNHRGPTDVFDTMFLTWINGGGK